MPSQANESPWLEKVSEVDETAIVKINPTVENGSVVYTANSDHWECLQIDEGYVQGISDSTGLIIEITKRTIPKNGEVGYVFVDGVIKEFDITAIQTDNTEESDGDQQANKDDHQQKEEDDGQQMDSHRPNYSKDETESSQKLRNNSPTNSTHTSSEKMSDIDVSKF
jgi:hypothetical protein